MDTKKLRQKILDLAIRGKLVPQDPNDEPASVLIEKIRAEKELLIKEKKIKRDKNESQIYRSDKSYYEQFADGTIKCIDDEIPFEIPESWEWVRLSDIGNWQSGATPNRSNKDYYGGDILWLKTGDLTDNYIYNISETITQKALQETSVKLNPSGSILLAMYGATIGKVGILTLPATTNQACCACSEFRGIHNIFLFYLLIAYREYFIHIGEGGAQPNISKEKIVSTYIPLPPLEEQHRIITEIQRLLLSVEILEENKISLEQFITQTKSKILDLAIQGKLVPQDPNDEPASVLLERIKTEHPTSKKKAQKTSDNSHYPFEIPESWEWCQVGEIGDIITGSTPSKDHKEFYGSEFPFYKPTDLEQGINVVSAIDNLSLLGYEVSRQLPANSLLVTCIGATIGKIGLIRRNGSCNQQINAVIPYLTIESKYFYYFFISIFFQTQIKENASATTLPIINKNKFRSLKVSLPPAAEQKRIVKKIKEIFASLDKIVNSIIA